MPKNQLVLRQQMVQRQNLHQIQMARLLEVPSDALEEAIEQEVSRNPALETEVIPGPLLTYATRNVASSNNETPSSEENFFSSPSSEDKEDYYGPYNYSAPPTLAETLRPQLALLDLSPQEVLIAEYLIGCLSPDGYLREPADKIAKYFTHEHQQPTTPQEIETVIRKLQTLDPPGVFARNLQESLLLQLEKKEPSPEKEYAYKVIRDYFDLLARRQYQKILQKLHLTPEQWREVEEYIRHHLTPHPAGVDTGNAAPYVAPDFKLEIENGDLRVELLRFTPRKLRISRQFKEFMERVAQEAKKGNKEAEKTYQFAKERLEDAERFLSLLRQRETTLRSTAQEIVRHQRRFFLTCDEKNLVPLTLQQIAQATNLDISTISRVVNSKYILCPCGIYPLKFFFSEGIRTTQGKEVSNKVIKKIIQELVDSEPADAPYTDAKIEEVLREKGYEIRRRTVAKYRQQLGILPARLREKKF
ncbi:MAG: RNA polymerase factor sigma-54 [Bacteroidia bacterium]